MKTDFIIIISAAAFILSAAVSYISGRILRGLLLPFACFALYLGIASLHATGWKLDEVGEPLAFAIAIAILMGLPIGFSSLTGALLGSRLSNRFKPHISTNSFGITLLIASVISGVFASGFWLYNQYRERQSKNEEELAKDFVKNNSAVIQKVGHSFEPFLSSSKGPPDGPPIRYEFDVGSLYAIISVSRLSGTPQFTLDCITPVSVGYRDSSKDDCKQ